MKQARANAISRLLTNAGLVKQSAENPGFSVFQAGPNAVNVYDSRGDWPHIINALEGHGYYAFRTVDENDDKRVFVRVAGQ